MSVATTTRPIAAQYVERVCALCGQDNHQGTTHPDGPSPWRLRTCSCCGFVYLENPVAYAELEQNFAWEKQVARRHEENRVQEPVFGKLRQFSRSLKQLVPPRQKLTRLINRYLPPGPVLDVGCGYGRVFRLIGNHVPFGIEIGREQAERANRIAEQRGGRVLQCDAITGLNTLDAGSFAGVVLCSFLEHESQPRELLEGVVRVLKPGGSVIIKVPNYNCINRHVRGPRWCGYRFPDHVNYFTPSTLTAMLKSCGLAVIRFGLSDRPPLSDNMWCVAKA